MGVLGWNLAPSDSEPSSLEEKVPINVWNTLPQGSKVAGSQREAGANGENRPGFAFRPASGNQKCPFPGEKGHL